MKVGDILKDRPFETHFGVQAVNSDIEIVDIIDDYRVVGIVNGKTYTIDFALDGTARARGREEHEMAKKIVIRIDSHTTERRGYITKNARSQGRARRKEMVRLNINPTVPAKLMQKCVVAVDSIPTANGEICRDEIVTVVEILPFGNYIVATEDGRKSYVGDFEVHPIP